MNARLVTFGAIAGLLVAAFGCQIIVGSDPPPFSCEEGKAGTCPSGQFCSGGVCVSGAPTDTLVPPDPEDGDVPDSFVPPDAKPDVVDSGLPPVGASCQLNKDCASGLCGTEGLLGQAAQATGSVCTQLCCTSAQCPSGFVCLAPGTGGSYCVSASKVLPERQVPATGGASGGTTCTANSDCRSGLCGDVNDGGTKRCIDNCCRASDCGTGQCAVGTINGKYTGFVCTEPRGNFNTGTTCTLDTSCKSNLCYPSTAPSTCRQRCCASKDCTSGNACIWDFATATGVVDFCFASGSLKAAGETCTRLSDCASTHCELETDGQPDAAAGRKVCRDLCCTDTDCPANQRCLPALEAPRVLRCVPK